MSNWKDLGENYHLRAILEMSWDSNKDNFFCNDSPYGLVYPGYDTTAYEKLIILMLVIERMSKITKIRFLIPNGDIPESHILRENGELIWNIPLDDVFEHMIHTFQSKYKDDNGLEGLIFSENYYILGMEGSTL